MTRHLSFVTYRLDSKKKTKNKNKTKQRRKEMLLSELWLTESCFYPVETTVDLVDIILPNASINQTIIKRIKKAFTRRRFIQNL